MILRPLSWLYRLGVAIHNPGVARAKADIPLVSVGNLEVGGTGKSPIAQAICLGLSARKARPALLSRGYGGSLRGPIWVDPQRHAAAQVGDEPLMHARFGIDTFICGNRAQSAALAAAKGHDIAVLDDGHATKSVIKDFSILVFRPGFTARPYLLPAGRLREPLRQGLARADLLVVNGTPTHEDTTLAANCNLPVITGGFEIQPPTQPQQSKQFVLVTGVANPERVLKSAHDNEWPVAHHLTFADHHKFTASDLSGIEAALDRHKAQLLTTAKDVVRLPDKLAQKATVLAGQWHPSPQCAQLFDDLLDQLSALRHQ